jgi:hypothetical protein
LAEQELADTTIGRCGDEHAAEQDGGQRTGEQAAKNDGSREASHGNRRR